ncbi:hypothetical protein [Nocardia sp. NPDC003979]
MRDNTPIDHDHGANWLDAEPTVLQSIPGIDAQRRPEGGDKWEWIDDHSEKSDVPVPDRRTHRPRRRPVWLALAFAVTVAVACVLIGAGIATVSDRSDTAIPTLTAAPPTTTTRAVIADACVGLSGPTVTDGVGDIRSVPGVIAAFEHAYYQRRDAEAALRLVAPEAGLSAAALTDGIASIPPGTTHCVAITPIADTAAEVHLVERHPDGRRIDYLQLINTQTTPHGDVLIINIQKRA